MLSHAVPAPSPLPDAVLTSGAASVAIVAKQRGLDRRELERQLIPLIASYGHTLLVLPTVSRHTREWFDQLAGQATVIGFPRDPRTVTLPQLPTFAALEPTERDGAGGLADAETCGPVWRFTHITAHRPPVADAARVARQAAIVADTGRQPRRQRA